MTNRELHGYRDIPVCDSHFHLTYDFPLDMSLKMYRDIIRYFGYKRVAFMALPNCSGFSDPADNLKALWYREQLNTAQDCVAYAYGGLFHYYDGRDTAEGYLRQAETLHRLGFDGYKLLDGKPNMRKKLGKRLDDSIFDGFYGYAESKGMPVKLHLGDPPENWDITKVSPDAVKNGWFCDGTYPTLEELRSEVEGILTEFPDLKLCLAHFYFLSQDIDACESLFERRKNVSFDLTPGSEMFANFSQCPDKWQEFFTKYSDRIFYGTDTYNNYISDNLSDYEKVAYPANLIRNMLETSGQFTDRSHGTLNPLSLDTGTLTKIYGGNLIKLNGEPRKADAALAAEEASRLLSLFKDAEITTGDSERDCHEEDNLRQIYTYFTQACK